MITLFASVKHDGSYIVIRVRFKPYLPGNKYDVSWVDGKLMELGFYATMIFGEGDSKYFNEAECELIELE